MKINKSKANRAVKEHSTLPKKSRGTEAWLTFYI